jgi:hypothetical protein
MGRTATRVEKNDRPGPGPGAEIRTGSAVNASIIRAYRRDSQQNLRAGKNAKGRAANGR